MHRLTRQRARTVLLNDEAQHFDKDRRDSFLQSGPAKAGPERAPASFGKRTRRRRQIMDVKIKMSVEFSVSEQGLEEALAEFDELTVEGLIAEVLDKSIACDEIVCKVVEGPNNLEEYDEQKDRMAV
ncbi:MAG: hypothetical protein CBC48_01205 [bacterium TMED88]|nr:hypothetical protein [Deltaproteobacteria bacterium]OUV36993.1 MAG: hypothetical protein CBC48_01205 [bacterium TMED88]